MSKVGEVWAIVAVSTDLSTVESVEIIGSATSLAVAQRIVEDRVTNNNLYQWSADSEVENSFALFDDAEFITYIVSKVDVVD